MDRAERMMAEPVKKGDYWKDRMRPGERSLCSDFATNDLFEYMVTMMERLGQQARSAIETGEAFRFELEWDPKAERTSYCFFFPTEDAEASMRPHLMPASYFRR